MSQKRTNLESTLSVSPAKSTRRIRKASGLMALEPRFMFDGAGAVDAVDKTVHLSLSAPTASGLTAATVAAQSDAERMVTTFLSGTNAREQSFQLFNGGQTSAQPSAEWLASFQQLLDNVTQGQVNVKVELLSNTEMQGAKGAFSATGTSGQATIYLNAEWLARADRESISRVMVEEMGHFLDATLNDGADTAGDEGEMFSRVVFDGANPLAVSYLSAQDDHAVLTLNGQPVAVELASFNFVNAYAMVYDLNNNGSIEGNLGETPADKEQNSHNFNTTALGAASINDNTNSGQFSGNDVSAIGINIGGSTYYGWISRPIKAGGIVRGFYFWSDPQFTTLATAQADGNQDGDGNPNDNKGFVLVVDQAWFTSLINANHTTLTLNNAFDGNLGSITYSNVGSSSDRVDAALNSLLPVNAAPVAVADASNLALSAGVSGGPALEQGAVVTTVNAIGNVLDNDTDANAGDTLTVKKIGTSSASTAISGATTSVTGTSITGAYGTLTIGSDGTYKYVVNNSLASVNALRTTANTLSDTFTYSIADSTGLTSTATLTIKIQGSNDAPVASPDYNTAKESTTVAGSGAAFTGYSATGNVLNNDTDVDTGDGKSINGTSGAMTIGSLVTDNSGTAKLTFIGDSGFNSVGTGKAVFVLVGGNYCAVLTSGGANVTIGSNTLVDSNTNTYSLGLSATPAYYYSSGGNVAIADVSAFFASNKSLGFKSSSSTTTETTNSMKTATVSVASVAASTITPTANTITGTVAVGMTVSSASGVPAATKVSNVIYDSSGNILKIELDKVITTATGQTLTFSGAAGSTLYGRHGSLVLNADGTYTYTPFTDNVLISSGTSGVDQFNYTMQDTAGQTSTSTLYITVYGTGSSDPSATADTASSIEAGGTLNGTAGTNPTGNLLSNDTTPTGSNVVASARSNSASSFTTVGTNTQITGQFGTLTISSTGAYTYTLNNSNAVVEALQSNSQTLVDTFTYTINNGTASRVSSSTLTVTIYGRNDAPVAANDSATAIEASGNNNGISGYDPSGNVLSNDTDVDDPASALVVSAVRVGATEGSGTAGTVGSSLTGTYGALTLNADGSWSYAVDNTNAAVNALASGQTLTESFNYTVTDRSGSGTDKLNDIGVLNITIQGAADTVAVNSVFVNEASPYAVFTVTGRPGATVSLILGNTTGLATTDARATLSGTGADIGTQLKYFDGVAWQTYNPASPPALLPSGTLLVSVAVNQDSAYEGNESFTLNATTSDGSVAQGIGTINDEGAGDLVTLSGGNPAVNNGSVTLDTVTTPDDDRPLVINNVSVNEGSPYSVFTVSGKPGQQMTLSLSGISAVNNTGNTAAVDGSVDFGPALQYFDGTTWQNYTPGSLVSIASTKSALLVRTAIINDTVFDNNETFKLIATNTGQVASTGGVGTIKDDGTGSYFDTTNNTGVSSLPGGTSLNDDRGALGVTGGTYNEGSPYAIFMVDVLTGIGNNSITLSVTDQTATLVGSSGQPTIKYSTDGGSTWTTYDVALRPLDLAGTILVAVDISREADTPYEGAETFLLTATAGANSASDISTIKDDGTGDLVATSGGNPQASGNVVTLDTSTAKDDDRPLAVTSYGPVNEGSTYAMFKVDGTAGATMDLALQAATSGTAATTSGFTFQYSIDGGANWVTYSVTQKPVVPAGGSFFVRVNITTESDNNFEGAETFALKASYTNNTSKSAAADTSIIDDGTGTKYDGTLNGASPSTNTTSLDDDRSVSVTAYGPVNEGSTYAMFKVDGTPGYSMDLALQFATSGTAATTSGFTYQYSIDGGSSWVTYDSTHKPVVPAGGSFFVRVDITTESDSNFEGAETFALKASYTSNTSKSTAADTSIIDDGTGTKYDGTLNGNNPAGNTTNLDNDNTQTLAVTGYGPVNEGSPYAMFKVDAAPGQSIDLTLQAASSGRAATIGGFTFQYSLDGGSTWITYDSQHKPIVPAGGSFFVRVDITSESDADFEGAETFALKASYTANPSITGTSDTSIVDNGTGTKYDGTLNGSTPSSNTTNLDDDQPRPIPRPVPPTPPASPPTVTPELPVAPPPAVPKSFNSAVQPLAIKLAPPAELPATNIGDILTSNSGFPVVAIENAPPGLTLNKGITDQFVEQGTTSGKFTIPYDAFMHSKKDAVINLQAKQGDDAPLPAWVKFDPQTGTFEANPPPNFKGKVELKVIARDDDGREATSIFRLFVGDDAPAQPKPQSRNSLSDKIRLAAKRPGLLMPVTTRSPESADRPVRTMDPAITPEPAHAG